MQGHTCGHNVQRYFDPSRSARLSARSYSSPEGTRSLSPLTSQGGIRSLSPKKKKIRSVHIALAFAFFYSAVIKTTKCTLGSRLFLIQLQINTHMLKSTLVGDHRGSARTVQFYKFITGSRLTRSPVAGNERGDIEIDNYVVLPRGEDNLLKPRPLILDFTMTHDHY